MILSTMYFSTRASTYLSILFQTFPRTLLVILLMVHDFSTLLVILLTFQTFLLIFPTFLFTFPRTVQLLYLPRLFLYFFHTFLYFSSIFSPFPLLFRTFLYLFCYFYYIILLIECIIHRALLIDRDAAGRAGHGSGRVRQIFTGRVGSRVSKF